MESYEDTIFYYLGNHKITYMGINRSPLPQNNGNLPLPFFGDSHPIIILYQIY